MGWKKDFKKQFNDRRKSIFDYSDGESSVIIWERSNGTPNTLTIENIIQLRRDLQAELSEENSFNNQPESLKSYSFVFNNLGISEFFDSYLTISNFENITNHIRSQFGNYAAEVVNLMLVKWVFHTETKFWNVFNLTFAGQSSFDDGMAVKIFEAMKMTGLESIGSMMAKAVELLETVSSLDPYRHYLMIEEIIDLGEECTWHWSKMLDQVTDLGVESMYAENTEDFYGDSDTIEFDSFTSDFEDFFEKTKTMALNSELDEAFEYFGMGYGTSEAEFKKMYRLLAKQYHPDVNKDPSAAVEMKRINMYKSIVEEYLERAGA